MFVGARDSFEGTFELRRRENKAIIGMWTMYYSFLRAVCLPFGHTPNQLWREFCMCAIKEVLIVTHPLTPILLSPSLMTLARLCVFITLRPLTWSVLPNWGGILLQIHYFGNAMKHYNIPIQQLLVIVRAQ